MTLVHDQLADGRAFRMLTAVDKWKNKSAMLEAKFRLIDETVAFVLKLADVRLPWPRSITSDHGTAFTSRALDQGACKNGAALDFARPEKLADAALCESFRERPSHECLAVRFFLSNERAGQVIEHWQQGCNDKRPQGALVLPNLSRYTRLARRQAIEESMRCFVTTHFRTITASS